MVLVNVFVLVRVGVGVKLRKAFSVWVSCAWYVAVSAKVWVALGVGVLVFV